MQEKRSFYLLLVIMSIVTLTAMAVTNVILYQVSFKETEQSLVQTAKSQARLIEAVARYNRRTNRVDWETPIGERGPTSLLSERAAADTIAQLKDAHQHYAGFGETGEFVLAGIEGENIVFLLRHRHEVNSDPEPIPLYSENAEPIRRALFVQSGTMVAKDYRGVEVLAAYEPVDVLNFGIVAKIDMAEIRAPFIRGVIYTWLISMLVILMGGILFRRITDPIEAKILDSEQQHRALVEEINEWVWEVDEKGVLTYNSPQINNILGYQNTQLIGRKLIDFMEQKKRVKAQQVLTNARLIKPIITNFEASMFGESGRMVPMEFSASPIIGKADEFLGYRGVARDISERKRAEQLQEEYQHTLEQQVEERTEELHEINEELKSFTNIVSHDLRSPLVSIVGFSSEIKEDIQLVEKALTSIDVAENVSEAVRTTIPESLGYIDKAAEKMEGLISSILELSRIGRRELHIETVNSAEIVEHNLKAIAYQLHEIDVITSNLPILQTDALSLGQIFGNLLGNAVKFLSPERSGEIVIWAEKKADFYHFYIQDNGQGIAEKDIPHIFELFKRVGNQQIQGDGMGLTYVQTLVRRLGGRIHCESILGKSTTFSFTLPVKSIV